MPQHIHIALIDTTGVIRFERLKRVAAALQKQVRRDAAQFWEVDATVSAMRHGDDVRNGTWPVRIVPDLRGGSGFHFDENGAPFAKVAIGPAWTLSASHEVLEMAHDPTGNKLHHAPAIHVVGDQVHDAPGEFHYLMEICDPCESPDHAYHIDGIAVSDFYTPHYFDARATAGKQYSFNRRIVGPRQVPKGGYLCWFNPRLGKMQMLRYLKRDKKPRIHTFNVGSPGKRSLREMIDTKVKSMHHLATQYRDHPAFR
jgi:hypothetical protein